MNSMDKRLDFLLAKCAADVDRAQQFVSRLSTDEVKLAIEERDRLLPGATRSQVQKRVDLIARNDPKYVATVIKGWMADER
jgi:flagellar biosynthesis/type III secretory pathway M-ring protein FliF/YscJ